MNVGVKICGLTDQTALNAAVEAGADYVGLVFFPPSPRAVTPDQAAALAGGVEGRVKRVGLFVDPSDDEIDAVLARAPLDLLQLHGDESPDRAGALRRRTGLPVIKALKIAEAEDLDAAQAYEGRVDFLLFDAKPPKGATRPGGNAEAFDWTLLAGRDWSQPWFLAGGLTADNIGAARRISGARLIDASSGVEDAPGRKSADKIREFVAAARR
ncbi:MAG: phosphoribosylanthranilate isomerase [Alphaproteobacteria bacterium]|nr:phosphoribosylanthranilate isomerase [Alphaproteobacteria bacterium]